MVYEDVAVASVGETDKDRPTGPDDYRSLEEYYAMATRLTLDGTGLHKDDVAGLGVVNSAVDTPNIYAGRLAETLGFENVRWTTAVDTGGASATSLLLQGALAVDAGIVDTFLCLGADVPVDPLDDGQELFPRDPSGYVTNHLDPHGTQGPNSRLAHVQTVHMDAYGTTLEQLGAVSVTQRDHATRNPLAYFDDPIDIADYVDAPLVADPVRLLDCVIPVNSGYGVLLAADDVASTLPVEPVRIAGFGECTNYAGTTADGATPTVEEATIADGATPAGDEATPADDEDTTADDEADFGPPDVTRTGVGPAAADAFGRAGWAAADADCLQVYDDYPVVVLMELADLGLCEPAAAGRFVAETDLSYDGALPLNTGGGQLSAGQSGMAGGFVQLVEAVRQLQGDGGDRQVPGAERGVVTGVGGVAYGRNLRHNAVVALEREVAA